MFDLRNTDLRALNSLTKYPSIPTYHALDPQKQGRLTGETVGFTGTVYASEKVDGTNARIIFTPDQSYVIGSREELLYGKGDLVGNPALGIVEALRDVADRLVSVGITYNQIVIFYGEIYGGKVTANSKQYSGEKRVGFRLFDIAHIEDYEDRLAMPLQSLSLWRENGGQPFYREWELRSLAVRYELELAPRITHLPAEELPQSLENAYAFLKQHMPKTQCALDETALGRPEGLILRSDNRSIIAKMRYEDYERTLKRR